jgi:hypothetical protein
MQMNLILLFMFYALLDHLNSVGKKRLKVTSPGHDGTVKKGGANNET